MFVQIETGVYTYKTKEGREFLSHALYALDEAGQIFKYIPGKGKWLKLEECNIKMFTYDEKN